MAFVLDAKVGAEVDEVLLVFSCSIHPVIPVLGTLMFDDISDKAFWKATRELLEVPFFILVESCFPGVTTAHVLCSKLLFSYLDLCHLNARTLVFHTPFLLSLLGTIRCT